MRVVSVLESRWLAFREGSLVSSAPQSRKAPALGDTHPRLSGFLALWPIKAAKGKGMSKARRFISVRRYGWFGLAVSFRESPRSVSCFVTRVGISPILRCRFRSWGRSYLSPTLSACVSPVPLFHPRRSALPFLGGRAGAKRPKAPFSSRAFYPLTILLSSVYILITY